jgi:RNA polymerase sigma-70 factor (ECF subfamily)
VAVTLDPSDACVDRELIAQIESGSAGAFEALYDRHHSAALRLARSLCRDDGRAEEAVQDAFMEIWSHPARYAAGRGEVVGWLLCIVRYRALDVSRRNVKHASHRADVDDIGDQVAPGTTATTVADRDEAAQLTALLGRLPDRQQKVIALAFYGQLTHSEIAAKLQLPVGTVKGRMRLGLKTLRGDLEHAVVSERWHGALTAALYAGELDRSLEIVCEAASEMPAASMFDDVLAPAMHAIGSLWARNEITIFDEQRASATCDRLLAQVAALLQTAPAKTKETVAFAALGPERHTFGLRMARDVMAGAGYDTVMLGAVASPPLFRAALAYHRPAIVALSTTMPHARTLAAAVAAIRDAFPTTHIILGGAAARSLGSDRSARHVARVDAIVETAEVLLRGAGRGPAPPQLPAPTDLHAAITT